MADNKRNVRRITYSTKDIKFSDGHEYVIEGVVMKKGDKAPRHVEVERGRKIDIFTPIPTIEADDMGTAVMRRNLNGDKEELHSQIFFLADIHDKRVDLAPMYDPILNKLLIPRSVYYVKGPMVDISTQEPLVDAKNKEISVCAFLLLNAEGKINNIFWQMENEDGESYYRKLQTQW